MFIRHLNHGDLTNLLQINVKSPPLKNFRCFIKTSYYYILCVWKWFNYGCSFTPYANKNLKGSAPAFYESRMEMEEEKKPNNNQNETKTKPKESFVFYRSFYEAIKDLDCDTKVEIYDAICEYSLNQNETEIEGIGKAILTLIKPLLDANLKRYKNGCFGGRPKTKTKPNENQKETKPEPNDNDNVNVNVYGLNLNTNASTDNKPTDCNLTDLNFKKEKEKKEKVSQSVSDETVIDLTAPYQAITSLRNSKTVKPTVKITDDFTIDFENDEYFQPYRHAGPELRQALNSWFIKNKLNQYITKDFIARQITHFAKNLGKMNELLGE